MKKTKKNKYNKKRINKIHLIFVLPVICFLVILLFFASQRTSRIQNTQQYASGMGKDLYGIASGDVLPHLSTTDLNRYLDDYKAVGSQWVRFDIDWLTIQAGGPNSYNWGPYDAVVNAAASRGIKVLGMIGYTPQWALAANCPNPNQYFCPPANPSDYAAFASAAVSRYAPLGVHNWEIWNEPNGGTFTAASYSALLKAAYPVMKQADPTAYILAGGSMPAATNGIITSPIDFLSSMYQNGAKNYFDALAHHPYCYDAVNNGYNCPPTAPASWSAWSQMQDTNPSLRSVMIANGDQNKKIWATEFGAPTGGDVRAVTESQQAQMVTDAYTLFNSYSWSGPLFWHSYKDKCTTTTDVECYFGLVRIDYSPKPAYTAYQNMALTSSGATTPNPLPTNTPTPLPTATSTPTLVPTNTPTLLPTPTLLLTSTPTPLPVNHGLTGNYFANQTLSGIPIITRIDAQINFNWGTGSPAVSIPFDHFSVRWTGTVMPQYSQLYTIYTQSDDGVRVWVNKQQLINNWTNHSSTQNSGKISLTAGIKYPITMEYYENTGGATAQLLWSSATMSKQTIPQARLFSK